MYFSTIRVDQDVWKFSDRVDLLRAKDNYHQFVWSLFEHQPDVARDFLYRADIRTMPPRFHVLSKRPPTNVNGLTVRTAPFKPVFKKDDLLSFDIRVNPTVQKSRGPNKRSAKHDVVMDAKTAALANNERVQKTQYQWVVEAVSGWLERRSETRGFELLPTQFHVSSYVQHTIRRKGKRRPIQFSTADCKGTLRVTDPDIFLETVQQGLGASRAFGCGLWLLKRANF